MARNEPVSNLVFQLLDPPLSLQLASFSLFSAFSLSIKSPPLHSSLGLHSEPLDEILGLWLVCVIAIDNWNEWQLSSMRARSQIMQSEPQKPLWWKIRGGERKPSKQHSLIAFSAPLVFCQFFCICICCFLMIPYAF